MIGRRPFGAGLRARVPVISWVVLGLACGSPVTRHRARAEDRRTDELPVCREPLEGPVLAMFDGRGCPWMLLPGQTADTLRLASLLPDPPEPITGPMPEGCSITLCEFVGADTPLGPMVVATRRSPGSEMPDDVRLGVVAAGRLDFIGLWDGAGEHVSADHTDVGPAHALHPWVCDKALGLFIAPRLPAGEGVEPSPQLRTREGIYALDRDELAPSPGTRDHCEPLLLPMP